MTLLIRRVADLAGVRKRDARYSSRRTAGKAHKVALVACMRKLLTIVQAMMKHRTPWQAVEPTA